MTTWAFYPAFIGTVISVVGWTFLARREHITHIPRTLSELAADKPHTLRYYRIVLWICGPLFAMTTYLFIVPRIEHAGFVATAFSITIVGELLVGVFPARPATLKFHNFLAAMMVIGMVASAYLFAVSLHHVYAYCELSLAIVLSILALLTCIDIKRYLFYELPFIYLAHVSILVAALGVR